MLLCLGDKEGFLCAVKEPGVWRESTKALQGKSCKLISGIQRAGSGLLGCGQEWGGVVLAHLALRARSG